MQFRSEAEQFTFDALYIELTGEAWELPINEQLSDWGAAYSAHPGLQRIRNEDRISVAHLESDTGELRCAIVCDGVGGTENGHLASSAAIAAILSYMGSADLSKGLRDLMVAAICHADDKVRSLLGGTGATTLCMLCMHSDGSLAAASVGDSRIYSWDRRLNEFRQLSVDDTLENELKYLNIANAAVLDAKGVRRSLSQAIGERGRRSDDLRINFLHENDLEQGVVLATDGLWVGGEEPFIAISRNAMSAQTLVRRSVAYALWSGGYDNSAIVAIQDLSKFYPPPRSFSRGSPAKIYAWIGQSKFTLLVPRVSGEKPSTLRSPPKKASRGRSKSKKDQENSNVQPNLLKNPDSGSDVHFSSDKEGDE